jgi:glycosyltransferase involved in cell wall biosynthesis
MSNIIVSVIIPCFNSEKWILSTIGSVYNQTYKNLEIIVVDDGSTDNTKDIIEANFKEVRYFFQKNSGPSSARNKGIENAKGKYLAFLDSDDLWEPKKLEKQIEIIQKSDNYEVCTTNVKNVDENLNYLFTRNNKVSKRYNSFLIDFFNGKIKNSTPTLVVTKDRALEVGGFPIDLPMREDHFFIMKCVRQGNYIHIKEPLVIRRKVASGMSNKFNKENYIDYFKPFIIKSLETFPILKRYKKKSMSNLYISLSFLLWEDEDYVDAKKSIHKAISFKKIQLKSYMILIFLRLKLKFDTYKKFRL